MSREGVLANSQQVQPQQDSRNGDYPAPYDALGERVNHGDLKGNVDATRPLSLEDLQILLDLSNYVIDKREPWTKREHAARDLGYLGHTYAVPALLAVLRDHDELTGTRRKCVYALSLILDKLAVYLLVEDGLGSNEPDVAFDAHRWLVQMVANAHPPRDLQFQVPGDLKTKRPDPDQMDREHYLQERKKWLLERARFLREEWRSWWREHKHQEIELQRADRYNY